jgi:hypothetical protein
MILIELNCLLSMELEDPIIIMLATLKYKYILISLIYFDFNLINFLGSTSKKEIYSSPRYSYIFIKFIIFFLQ